MISPLINTYGLQQVQSLSCVTAATLNAQCGTTLTLPVAEPDINYLVQCNGYNASANFYRPRRPLQSTTSFVWNIANLGSTSGGETISCLITHL